MQTNVKIIFIIFILISANCLFYGLRAADDPYIPYAAELFKINGGGNIPDGLQHGLENLFSSSIMFVLYKLGLSKFWQFFFTFSLSYLCLGFSLALFVKRLNLQRLLVMLAIFPLLKVLLLWAGHTTVTYLIAFLMIAAIAENTALRVSAVILAGFCHSLITPLAITGLFLVTKEKPRREVLIVWIASIFAAITSRVIYKNLYPDFSNKLDYLHSGFYSILTEGFDNIVYTILSGITAIAVILWLAYTNKRTQNTEHRTQNTEHRTQNQNTEHRTHFKYAIYFTVCMALFSANC